MIGILLEEIKFLKIKNELIKLKSNFQETIFYSIMELIEELHLEEGLDLEEEVVEIEEEDKSIEEGDIKLN